jgi:hypothetical protein
LWTAGAILLLLAGGSGAARGAPAPPALPGCAGPPKPVPTTFYDFSAAEPTCGVCEQKAFGRRPVIAEPINLFFSLTTVALGALGVLRSRRTTMAFQFLYGLLAAYGLSAALEHALVKNGYYRMMDVAISMVQSFVIVMLFHSLYLYRVKRRGREAGKGYRLLVSVMTLVFTAYPAAVHVAGESTASPWVAWLVFDLLWLLIAGQLILIWRRRATWPMTPPDARVFRLVWYALGATALAYLGWSIDTFACARWPAVGYGAPHGAWHLFMGLSFYYLITLSRFFSAHEYGFQPVVELLPARGWLRLPFVEWRSRRDPGDPGDLGDLGDLGWTRSAKAAPTRLPAPPRPKRA